MAKSNKIWTNVLDLKPHSPEVQKLKNNEFAEHVPVEDFIGDKEVLENSKTTRRDFLKFVGFSTAAATIASCEGPVVHSLPYAQQPDTVIPGVASYYATTIADGDSFGSILVKVREGRPIRVLPNTDAPAFSGSTARINASVLGLYDSNRFKGPQIDGKSASWSKFTDAVKGKLATAKEIAILTPTYNTPTGKKVISEFVAKYPTAKHYQYDAVAEFGAVEAYKEAYGKAALPSYDLKKAKNIVSIGADFLNDWFGGNFEKDYAANRAPGKNMSKHIQVESNLSGTGANADVRIPVKPSEQGKFLTSLYAAVTGQGAISFKKDIVTKIATELKANATASVVLVGSSDKNAQAVGYKLNEALGSEAFVPSKPNYFRTSTSTDIVELQKNINSGSVGVLISTGVNPVYTLPNGADFQKALGKTFHVAVDTTPNETNETANAIAATNHWLESWADFQMDESFVGFQQPTISPLFNTKQFEQLMLELSQSAPAVVEGTDLASLATAEVKYYEYLRKNNESNGIDWKKAIQDGFVSKEVTASASSSADVTSAITALNTQKGGELELQLYTKVGMGDGSQFANPWLQEFPDPISRASWDNYLTISEADASTYGLENEYQSNGAINGSYVNLTVNGVTINNVPVLIQPGQASGSVGLALGYGRTNAGKIAEAIDQETIGVNAYPALAGLSTVQTKVSIEKASGEHEFAMLQLHSTLMGRGEILKQTTNKLYTAFEAEQDKTKKEELLNLFNEPVALETHTGKQPVGKIDLWESFDRTNGHHFNLSIDLNSCTGCGACVIACHAENNVPVVGKEEVRNFRDMHWLRIDRYYSAESTFKQDDEKKEGFSGLFGENGSLSGFGELEDPSANPEVAFQPVMCQHCNHAPCETVCPVAATSHSMEGQNHMAYNRCVGTRYCANNCPYKVRRFNWFQYAQNSEFDFHFNDDLGRMVVNPDVNVRSRGVMEKCSMCVQMTQSAKLAAKKAGRTVKDEEFQTACTQSCSTGALAFGDINDKESEVAQLLDKEKNPRSYYLLEAVGTKPNVFYNVKVRNKA